MNIKPEQHSPLYWAFSDSWELIKRSMTHIFRNMDQLLSVAFQPIMFLLLFRYVFGGAIDTGNTSYVNFVIPGILIQTAAFGATYTALGVTNDLQRGIIDRFRSLPMVSSAVLVGHVTADLVRNTLSSIVMLLFGLLIGFRPTASFTEWAMFLGLLLLFTFAFSWVSAIMGLMAKSVEAVQWISFVLVFPLTFASSAFVPTTNMPNALKIFAENQPVTLVINALRSLLVDTPMEDYYVRSVIWCVSIIVISIPLAGYIFRRNAK